MNVCDLCYGPGELATVLLTDAHGNGDRSGDRSPELELCATCLDAAASGVVTAVLDGVARRPRPPRRRTRA